MKLVNMKYSFSIRRILSDRYMLSWLRIMRSSYIYDYYKSDQNFDEHISCKLKYWLYDYFDNISRNLPIENFISIVRRYIENDYHIKIHRRYMP